MGTPSEIPTFEQFINNRIAPPGRCQALVLIQGIVTKKPDKKVIEVGGVEFSTPPDRIAELLESAKAGEKAIASYWPQPSGEPEALMSLKEGVQYKELKAPVMILCGFLIGRPGDQNIKVRVEYRREGRREEKVFEVMLARPLGDRARPRDLLEFRAVYAKERWIASPVPTRRPRRPSRPGGAGPPRRGPGPGGREGMRMGSRR